MAENIMGMEHAWKSISKYLFVPHTEAQYEQLVSVLNELIDNVGSDETHPLASLMDVIGSLIEQYEDEHIPELSNVNVVITSHKGYLKSSGEDIEEYNQIDSPYKLPSFTPMEHQYKVDTYSGGTPTFPLKERVS